MLTDIEKQAIKSCYQTISTSLDGFRPRSAQRKMIAAIANTFSSIKNAELEQTLTQEGESIIAIEGPTGVGKSLAYLLAGTIMAQTRGKKLIISSATIALQEQLVYRDIPFFIEKSGLEMSFAIAKGRSRYLCPYRLCQLTQEVAQDDLLGFDASFAVWSTKPKPEEITLLRQISDEFSSRRFNGDKDDWPESIDDSLWRKITNDRHGCLKSACPNKMECPFYLARDTLENVDVVVVNHDLLLADISMGGGVILTEPSESFYCLDEAHRLPKKAINQFAAEHSLIQAQWFLERLPTVVQQIATRVDKAELVALLEDSVSSLLEQMLEWTWQLNEVEHLVVTNDNLEPDWLWEEGHIPEGLDALVQNTALAARMLLKHLDSLSEALNAVKKEGQEGNVQLDRFASELGFSLARAEQISAVWDLMEKKTEEKALPLAKWIERKNTDKNDFIFHASPVSAASSLANGLWQKASGVLLTSATLRSLNSFDLFLKQTGLNFFPKTTTLALDSPFDFTTQGELYLPNFLASPKDATAHTLEIVEWLPKLINIEEGVGTLVLFSSRKQMNEVALRLSEDFVERLLVQGDIPKTVLLQKHREAISQQKCSIIFGLESFAEGLDLPGEACVHVIIAKLPFSMPNEPVEKTLSQWIDKRGGNSFVEITVPQTSMKLIQAVGRLIRTENDYGRVSILDNRIKTASYGRKLLSSLPPFKRI